MSQKDNKLEQYCLEQIKKFDSKAKLTKASGATGQSGDVDSKYLYCECKMRSTDNVTIDRKVWYKLVSSVNDYNKLPILALENKHGDKFVVLDASTFFTIFGAYLNG